MGWIREHLIEWFCIIGVLVFTLVGVDARAAETVTYWTPDDAPTYLCVIITEGKHVVYLSCIENEELI